MQYAGKVLIYSIHNSEQWWRVAGANLGYEGYAIVSDMRGEGDYNVVDPFYRAYARLKAAGATESPLLSAAEVDDVIARCRLLRWLPRGKAAAMALAMAEAMEAVLDAVQPVAVVSWPIDRYVTDVLERRAAARGVPYFELTMSTLAEMSMLLYRGQLIERTDPVDPELLDRTVSAMADPEFTPAYVVGRDTFTAARWWKTFLYFKVRGLFFWGLSYLQRDPLNLHYLDSQAFLGHKPRLGDVAMLGLQDADWKERLDKFPKGRRMFLALQLFPEASIDYWIEDLGLVDHEDMLVEVAQAFSRAGYLIAVKDHPLQFGFRQVDLINRLKAIPNVVIVPYSISGNAVLGMVGVTFTCTGTLGMQAALLGLKAITTETYFTTPDDFIFVRSRAVIPGLPEAVERFEPRDAPRDRQRRIVEKLLRGSFMGDCMTFKGFGKESDPTPVIDIAQNLGVEIERLGLRGQNWHRHAAPPVDRPIALQSGAI